MLLSTLVVETGLYFKYGDVYSNVRKNGLSLTNINFRAYITTSGIYIEISAVEVLLKLNNFTVFSFDKISVLDNVFMCSMITTKSTMTTSRRRSIFMVCRL